MLQRTTFAFVAALSLVACQSAPTPGATCSAAADCASPLVCRLGRCRAECAQNRDCPVPARCLLDPSHLGSCSLDTDERCASGGHMCPAALICVGDQCASTCRTDADCPSDGVCRDAATTGQRFCFAPDRQDGGPPVDAASRIDTGSQDDAGMVALTDAGRDAGTDAGSDAGMDAFVALDAGADAGTDAAMDTGPIDAARPDAGACSGTACGQAHDLCATAYGTCAIRLSDQRVLCWGHAQILGDTYDASFPAHHACTPADACSVSPVSVRLPSGAPLVAAGLACAAGTVCAWTTSNEAFCWGDDGYGQLGYSPAMLGANPVPGVSDVRSILAGYATFCATNGTGTTTCWGDSTHGQLGTTGSATPATIALGRDHACFSNGTTSVLCRGSDLVAQLGPMGTGADSTTALTVGPFGGGVETVRASAYSTCVLNGSVPRCWGNNSCGETGSGAMSATQRMFVQAGSATYQRLYTSALSRIVCGQTPGGLVDCWGRFQPMSGCTSADQRITPTAHHELDGALTITMGEEHWCFLDSSNVVRCAGSNGNGQLARDPVTAVDDPAFQPVCISSTCVP
jgi:hypothetical protein